MISDKTKKLMKECLDKVREYVKDMKSKRPSNYSELSSKEKYEVNKRLGFIED
jgi:hypothetical protein